MEEWVRAFVTDYGVLALFVLMVLDNIGVPLPSEIPLLLGGFFIREGRMEAVPAVVVSALGSVAGALILYGLARVFGRAVIARWGRLLRIDDDDLARAEAWFHRRGEAAVFFLRVVPLARTIISIPAGILEMNVVRFTTYTLVGSLLWCATVIGIGWGMGASYERVLGGFGLAGFVAASVIAMVAAMWLVARFRRRRRTTPGPGLPPEADRSEEG